MTYLLRIVLSTLNHHVFRALFIRDGVKGYARKIHPKGYLFIADERQKKQIYGYGFIVERSELLARRCLLLEDKAVRIIRERTMDMTNVERVMEFLENGDYTITHYPCRASIKIEER